MHLIQRLILITALISGTAMAEQPIAIAIHGGAGTIRAEQMTGDLETRYHDTLDEALMAGYQVLDSGGSSLDAVVAAIVILEDYPLFNAGKGAVFTNDGRNELDASIMDGRTLNAGAVAAVRHIRNPIELARLVLDESPHVMLIGEGAEKWAVSQDIELVPTEYFYTEERWKQLERARSKDQITLSETDLHTEKFGTVGAVALDRGGNLAAGTSTGGMTNKLWGRVGDSPIVGAGTYANNISCAVSATGHGEYFMRSVVAYDICVQMEYKDLSLERAAHNVVMEKLVERGGEGGVIAVDVEGNVAMPFNSEGMYRAAIDADGDKTIAIFK